MSDTTCPNCGETKERISRHWHYCGFPDPSEQQRAVLDGLMLAGATVAGNGQNRHVEIGTTSQPLAGWTADKLDWLCHSVREETHDGERATVYRIRTPAHEYCNRYEQWDKLPGNSGRAPPETLLLTAHAARVWWAFAGGLQWPDEYSSTRTATISAQRDARAGPLLSVLERVALDPVRAGKRIQLSPTQTTEWLAWIGDPVPGVAYKWVDSLTTYQYLQSQPTDADLPAKTSTEITKPDAAVAIRRAADAVGEPLTASRYTEWRRDTTDQPPSVDTIVQKYGWAELCDELGIRHGGRGPAKERDVDSLVDAVLRLRSDLSEWPTVEQYREHKSDSDPAATWLYRNEVARVDSWSDLINVASERRDD